MEAVFDSFAVAKSVDDWEQVSWKEAAIDSMTAAIDGLEDVSESLATARLQVTGCRLQKTVRPRPAAGRAGGGWQLMARDELAKIAAMVVSSKGKGRARRGLFLVQK